MLLGAAAVAVPYADAVWRIDVACSSTQEATLKVSGLDASYQCSNTSEQKTQPMDSGYFVVNVEVEKLTLELASSDVAMMWVSLSHSVQLEGPSCF